MTSGSSLGWFLLLRTVIHSSRWWWVHTSRYCVSNIASCQRRKSECKEITKNKMKREGKTEMEIHEEKTKRIVVVRDMINVTDRRASQREPVGPVRITENYSIAVALNRLSTISAILLLELAASKDKTKMGTQTEKLEIYRSRISWPPISLRTFTFANKLKNTIIL